ncbi:Mco12 protein [Maudiozyma humilis]|uniref:Mco12 protein n=1 Tax=Maudiozyma humilis TaxID=51915 RepID=A0AAV5RX41_MAUHU|nr:Mco12 protein [Kazachstania humilis]
MGTQDIIRWGVDLTLVAMLLAALRRQTGLVLAYERYDFTRALQMYLQWGEYCWNRFVGYARGDGRRFRKERVEDALRQRIEEL